MNKKQVPITLKCSGGYFDQKCQIDAYRRWLTIRGVSFTFILKGVYDDIPLVALIDSEDATAFKLRFGL